MIVVMAGLPGSGKSTLCRELAVLTSGVVLSKDEIRAALFAPADIEYSSEQDDFCMRVVLEAAGYILKKTPRRFVLLDGRTFSRRYQIDPVIAAAHEWKQPWRILECVCSDATARKRIEEQRGAHPAKDRDYALYLRTKERQEEITLPKTVIDTEQSLPACVARAREALG
ncbi:MAG TPA: ATP-binding protein [Terriglobales bacterium]|nr:ATP-binding protein [Terriglobales bacterium]